MHGVVGRDVKWAWRSGVGQSEDVMETTVFNRALVRLPAPTVVDGLRAVDTGAPSFEGIQREHAGYRQALRDAGVSVSELPPLDDYPDAIFLEDPALVFAEGAILLRPGTPTRENEPVLLEPSLRDAFDTVLSLRRGYADGGDVLRMPDTVFIGLSARTDQAGAADLVDLLAQLGLSGNVVSTPETVLHLKTACSIVDDETVLATAELAATGLFERYRVLVVPEGEERGANVLRVNDRILAGRSFPRTLDLLSAHGVPVVPLDVAEVGKIDAGLTCMSLRWRAG